MPTLPHIFEILNRFLELFTNIVAPLANEGNLKIALDIFDKSGEGSKDGAERICEFYQSLLNKNLDEGFIRDNMDNVLKDTAQLCVLIVLTKLNHHANALSKDLDLISPLTFGSLDPIGLLKENFANNNTDNEKKMYYKILRKNSSQVTKLQKKHLTV